MKNLLVSMATLMLTAACGAYNFPSGSTSPAPNTANVSGTVRSVPCAPVEQAGSPCAGRPMPSLEIDYYTGSTIVSRTVTDSKGAYSVDLKPGRYTVRLAGYMRVISGPTELKLDGGTSTVANYVLDNGIRIPLPQD